MYRSSADENKYDFSTWYYSGKSRGYRGNKDFRSWADFDQNGKRGADPDPDPEGGSDKDTASIRTDQLDDDDDKKTEKEVEHSYKNDVNEGAKRAKNSSIAEKSSPISGNSAEVRSENLSDDKTQKKSYTTANSAASSISNEKKSKTSDKAPKDRKNGSDNVSKNILHRKCNVIKLVRNQMETLQERIKEDVRKCTRCNKQTSKGSGLNSSPADGSGANGSGPTVWRKRFAILLCLLPLLLWITTVFGALAGAQLCGGKSLRVRNPHALY